MKRICRWVCSLHGWHQRRLQRSDQQRVQRGHRGTESRVCGEVVKLERLARMQIADVAHMGVELASLDARQHGRTDIPIVFEPARVPESVAGEWCSFRNRSYL